MKAEIIDNVEAIQLDVTSQESVENAVLKSNKRQMVLDILINDAEINGNEFVDEKPIIHTATGTRVDKSKEVFDVNVYHGGSNKETKNFRRAQCNHVQKHL